MDRPAPRYIVIEGIDGTGKSTLIAGLAKALRGRGVEAVTLVEPTSGVYGQEIRRNLGKAARKLSALEWLELFEKDRHENIEQAVKPALARRAWVLQDRGFYSTAAYQGAQGLAPAGILARNRAFAPEPDLVVILDLDPREAIERIRTKRTMETDAFEQADFLERVRANFRAFAGLNILHLDASRPAEETLATVLDELERRFGLGRAHT